MHTYKPLLESLEDRMVLSQLAGPHNPAFEQFRHHHITPAVSPTLTTVTVNLGQFNPDGSLTVLQQVDGGTINATEGVPLVLIATAHDAAGNLMTQDQIASVNWVGNGDPFIVVAPFNSASGFWISSTQNYGAVFPNADAPTGVIGGTSIVTVTMTDLNGNVVTCAPITVNSIGK